MGENIADGMRRRDFLRGLALSGLTLPELLAARGAQAQALKEAGRLKSATPLFRFDPANRIRALTIHRSSKLFDEYKTGTMYTSTMASSDELAALTTSGKPIEAKDALNRFSILQLKRDAVEVVNSFQVAPVLQGASDKPDIQLEVQLAAFHLAKSANSDADTRATLRVVINKSAESSDKIFDTVYWAVTSGMKLYDAHKNKKADAKELATDFTKKGFGGRPIEVPGALADISFEVVKHSEPAWYQRIWNMFKNEPAGRLLSTIGFPAVALETLNLLDELLGLLGDSDPEILFQSGSKSYALTKRAKDEYVQGYTGVAIESLNPGWWIIARGKDLADIVKIKPMFDASNRRLVPSSVPVEDWLSNRFKNPFDDMTYAVLRVGMTETKLNPGFVYRT